MRFADIPGYQGLKDRFVYAVKNQKIPHAILLQGEPGGLSLSMAWAFSAYLNCLDPVENDACGVCSSCQKIRKLIHPDLHVSFPILKAGENDNCKVYLKEWRQFIIEHPYASINDWLISQNAPNKQGIIPRSEGHEIIKQLSMKNFEGKFKIQWIWYPEALHSTAANALLKILEEPYPNTVFMLLSYQPESLLNTILSRTQLMNMEPLDEESLVQFLVREKGQEESKARQLALLSEGNLNTSLKLIDEEGDLLGLDFIAWLRDCWGFKMKELSDGAENFGRQAKTYQKNFFDYGLRLMRECLYQLNSLEQLVRVQAKEKDFVQNFAKAFDMGAIEAITHELNQAYYHLERNANAKLLFMDLSLKLMRILRKK